MNYFDLLKAKHGLPVSDAYTALLGKKLQGGGYPVTEIFGQLPFSFLSRGASIPEWALYGKIVQNGTPSVQTKTFEFGTLVQDSYVSSTDGTITPYSSWDRTDYIAIPADMKHVTVEVDSTYNNKYNCWYDENKQFISSFTIWNASSGTKILTADVPANAKYVIFSGPRNWMESASVTYQAIQPIPFQGVGERTANLYDINAKDINNGYVNNAQLTQDGTAAVWGSAEISEYIPINGDTMYTFNGIGSYNSPCYALYDENKQLIGAYRYNGASIIHFTSPDNARYFRFTHIKATASAMLVKGSYTQQTMPTFEPYGYKIQITSNGSPAATLYTDKPLYGDGTNDDYIQRNADETGSEHRSWGAYVCTGTETWSIYSVGNVHQFYVGDVVVGQTLSSCYSSIAQYGVTANNRSNYNFGCYLVTQGTGVAFQMYGAKDMFPTAAEWKSYLAAQYAAGTPVTVVYQLATPTDTPVTLPEIPTVVGTNTLDTDTTVHGDARIKGRIEGV